MKAKHKESIIRLTREVSELAKALPSGRYHQIANRCSKITMLARRVEIEEEETVELGEEKFIAKEAIKAALMNGRHLSQMDCKEFKVEDMRTPISHMRKDFSETHELKTRWIVTPTTNARIKEYWLERRESC